MRKTTIEYKLMKFSIPEPNTGCWLWFGHLNHKGYGLVSSGLKTPKTISTHRASYRLYKGEIPSGLMVLHTCDQPCCINPDHLFLGTAKDNFADMVKKGRKKFKRGSNHYKSKFCLDDVKDMIKRRESGETYVSIGKSYDCSANIVRLIYNSKERRLNNFYGNNL